MSLPSDFFPSPFGGLELPIDSPPPTDTDAWAADRAFAATLAPSPTPSWPDSPAPSPDAPPSSPARAPRSRSRSAAHIPRPRNAFMLFRAAFLAAQKLTRSIERDQRQISRVIGHCWGALGEPGKDVWREQARREKEAHARRYPGYRFSPVARTTKPVRRNVKRNGPRDLDRCRRISDLVSSGVEGAALEAAVGQIDAEMQASRSASGGDAAPSVMQPAPDANTVLIGWTPPNGISEEVEVPVFRSPLLPPTELLDEPSPFPDFELPPAIYQAPAPLPPPADVIAERYDQLLEQTRQEFMAYFDQQPQYYPSPPTYASPEQYLPNLPSASTFPGYYPAPEQYSPSSVQSPFELPLDSYSAHPSPLPVYDNSFASDYYADQHAAYGASTIFGGLSRPKFYDLVHDPSASEF